MVIVARKKPIEVLAYKYNQSVILDEFLKFLRSNENEPVRYDETDSTIYIQKERGEIAVPLGNYVIQEVNTDNCFWSIDPEIFQKTYERVPHTLYVFRKKIYDVECVELKSLKNEDIYSVLEFMGYHTNGDILKTLHMDELIEDCQSKGYVPIKTLEGIEALYPTEILIKGIDGEFYPVTSENFYKVYSVVSEV